MRSLVALDPFGLPSSWEWCRVGDLFTNMAGLAYKRNTLSIKADRMIRVLRGGNIGEEQVYFKGDDVFISDEFVKPELYLKKNYMITPAVSSLDHIGKIALIDKDYSDTVVGGFVLMLIPFFNDDAISRYLLYAFAAKHHRDNCRNITHKSGQAFYNLSREQMMNLPVPIPPRSEMVRIVEMLERLLPSVTEYAEAKNALRILNTTFPDQLKKSILQEAVQGRLVPQDPADEPASVLLDRIRAEKQRLIKEGKIKKNKHESIIFRRDNSYYEKLDGIERCIDDEIPFEIPENWKWTRFGQAISLLSGKDFKPEEYNNKHQGTPYITGASSLSEHGVLVNRWTRTPRILANHGDVLLVCKGSGYGKTVICDIEEAHIARQIMAIKKLTTLDMDYVRLFLQANFDQIKSKGQGVIPGIDRNSVMNLLFPIPPLPEQYRIIEKQQKLFDVITRI